MKVRKITSDNDWTFGKGRNNYLSGQEAVKQNIKTRIQSFLGDCFFSLQEGIDWFNLLGSKKIESLRLSISTTILNTEEVLRLNELSLDVDEDRNISISYSITTVYGTTEDIFTQGDINA